MLNNLPQKYEQSFVLRIKRFFSNLFNKKNNLKNIEEVAAEDKIKNDVLQDNVFVEMKAESKKSHLTEEIISMIRNNPKLLENLSIEQLEAINSMYDRVIDENNQKISKLKRKLV